MGHLDGILCQRVSYAIESSLVADLVIAVDTTTTRTLWFEAVTESFQSTFTCPDGEFSLLPNPF
jgi:hypothetical protein